MLQEMVLWFLTLSKMVKTFKLKGVSYECTNIEHSIRNDGIFY